MQVQQLLMVFYQVLQLLQGHAELQEHIQGFRYLDGRSLTGFIDMPGNPRGKAKRSAALISYQQQPVFAAGSYLYLQCNRLQLANWQQLEVAKQEELMGISKVSGQPLSIAPTVADSHFALLQHLADMDVRVLQQNMPFSRSNLHGQLLHHLGHRNGFHANIILTGCLAMVSSTDAR